MFVHFQFIENNIPPSNQFYSQFMYCFTGLIRWEFVVWFENCRYRSIYVSSILINPNQQSYWTIKCYSLFEVIAVLIMTTPLTLVSFENRKSFKSIGVVGWNEESRRLPSNERSTFHPNACACGMWPTRGVVPWALFVAKEKKSCFDVWCFSSEEPAICFQPESGVELEAPIRRSDSTHTGFI